MPENTVSPKEIHRRLVAAGHRISEERFNPGIVSLWPPPEIFVTVWPPPDVIVTVALSIDSTQELGDRQRYFVCRTDPDGYPVTRNHPDFVMPDTIYQATEREQSINDFTDGPIRWLWNRIIRFGRVLVWPNGIVWRPSTGERFYAEGVFDAIPQLRLWLGETGQRPTFDDLVAIEFDPTVLADCQVLCRIANLAARTCDEFFVGDPGCEEVYMLHHHEKIVVSIPNRERRMNLLDELLNWSDVLLNCSEYQDKVIADSD